MARPSLIDVDLDAIRHNLSVIRELVAPARVCVVVKADGYGHGAAAISAVTQETGDTWLAVALAAEGAELRAAGITAPILLLSEPTAAELAVAADAELTPTLYSVEGIDTAARLRSGWAVHLKVDTGMHRVGAQPDAVVDLARRALDAGLVLGGTFTHLAVADVPERPENEIQLRRFDDVLTALAAVGIDPGIRHAANSAAALHLPHARYDLVRVGIAAYGVPPAADVTVPVRLRSSLRLRSRVSFVNEVAAGEGVSYGWHHRVDEAATLAVVPVGYADGVPRNLGLTGGEVLIGGVRRPMRGVVTMDQLMVEITGDAGVAVGDEVVLLGPQGDDEITPVEWAQRVGTIPYEVLVGFGARVPRSYPG